MLDIWFETFEGVCGKDGKQKPAKRRQALRMLQQSSRRTQTQFAYFLINQQLYKILITKNIWIKYPKIHVQLTAYDIEDTEQLMQSITYFNNQYRSLMMFKNHEKRYEYDISSHIPDENQRYSAKYSNSNYKIKSDYPISSTTPLHKRSTLNYSALEDRTLHHISIHDNPTYEIQRTGQNHVQRGRASSATGLKKTGDRPIAKIDKSYLENETSKQTKKVYFGEEYQKEYQNINNTRLQQREYKNDENKRLNGQRNSKAGNNQRPNYSNRRVDSSKDTKQKRFDQQIEPADYCVNQKQIMQKIGRINRINEEINSRLQRMLNKIDF